MNRRNRLNLPPALGFAALVSVYRLATAHDFLNTFLLLLGAVLFWGFFFNKFEKALAEDSAPYRGAQAFATSVWVAWLIRPTSGSDSLLFGTWTLSWFLLLSVLDRLCWEGLYDRRISGALLRGTGLKSVFSKKTLGLLLWAGLQFGILVGIEPASWALLFPLSLVLVRLNRALSIFLVFFIFGGVSNLVSGAPRLEPGLFLNFLPRLSASPPIVLDAFFEYSTPLARLTLCLLILGALTIFLLEAIKWIQVARQNLSGLRSIEESGLFFGVGLSFMMIAQFMGHPNASPLFAGISHVIFWSWISISFVHTKRRGRIYLLWGTRLLGLFYFIQVFGPKPL